MSATIWASDAGIKAMVPNLHYQWLTKDSYRGHPLYLPKWLQPQPFAEH
jgi:hypothetical protein